MPVPVKARRNPTFTSTEAQLFVASIPASCAFYTEKLGFKTAFVYGDPPFYGQVARGRARLNLRVVGEPVFAGDVRSREHLLSASLTLPTADDVEQLYTAFRAAGVPLAQPLKREPWGAVTFVIRDPDANLILFAGPSA